MLKIAVTGPSGSGKGYICSILERWGIPCLDCDRVVHEIYKDDAFARALSSALKSDVSSSKGGVDRGLLRPLVFGNKENMAILQSVIYPPVRQRCLAFLEQAQQRGVPAAAVDAPQLFEAGFEGDYRLIVSVAAPEEERILRIMQRDGIDRSAALARMAEQMSNEEYAARSHAVIANGAGDDPERALSELLCRYGVCL
ncbi:MAG: dephospho-CoA kinase [Clostridia bacterium]|nr:dephospho-CoA kinase [Clostridia bacterium]